MKISLKKKKLKTGKHSLYIEYYKGSTKKPDGTQRHLREFEYLKLYLHSSPSNQQEKLENKETTLLAEKILSIKKAEYFQGKHSIVDKNKSKQSFLGYFVKLMNERFESKKNFDNWDAAYKHLKGYCNEYVTFEEVDEDFVRGFKNFLEHKAMTKSNTLLAQNSKYTYYNKFKACINQAFEEGYLTKNYNRSVKGFEPGESIREYLTFEEVQALYNTKCKFPVLKNAFLFCCLVGTRWSDVNKLTWSEVREENGVYRIVFSQKKTDAVEYLYISDEARELLGERGRPFERVFVGLKYSGVHNTEILRWCMRAGITKHITFHSSRHTNAVLLLENGADIYTVSKRLGHKELKTTEIYAKIIDKKMKEAAHLIPNISIKKDD